MTRLNRPASGASFRAAACLAGWIALTLLGSTSSFANPTGKQPGLGLKPHGTVDGAAEMINKLYPMYESIQADLDNMYANQSPPTKIKPTRLKAAMAKIWQAQRELSRMDATGETAITDLKTRYQSMHGQVLGLGTVCRATPAAQKFQLLVNKKHAKTAPARAKLFGQAKAAIAKGRGDAVLRKLESEASDFYSDLVLETPKRRGDKMRPFSEHLGAASQALMPALKTKIDSGYQAAFDREQAIANGLVDQIAQLKSQTASGFPIQVGDTTLTSATEFMQYLLDQTAEAHAAHQRIITLQRARGRNRTNREDAAAALQFADQSTTLVASAIARLVESTDSVSATAVHRELMTEITKYDRRLSPKAVPLSQAVGDSMAALAQKSPNLAASMAAYRRATFPVIEFRRRFTEKRVDKLISEGYPKIHSIMSQKTPTPKGKRAVYQLGARLGDTYVAEPGIRTIVKWQVAESAERLVGKKISDGQTFRLSANSRTGVVRFKDRHYTNLSVGLNHDAATQELKRVLLVNEQYGPLTFDAATLISAAEMKDYYRVGGPIARVHCESFVTRFATLPSAAAPLVAMGTLPSPSNQGPTNQALCWRIDLRPEWVATEAFVALADDTPGKLAAR